MNHTQFIPWFRVSSIVSNELYYRNLNIWTSIIDTFGRWTHPTTKRILSLFSFSDWKFSNQMFANYQQTLSLGSIDIHTKETSPHQILAGLCAIEGFQGPRSTLNYSAVYKACRNLANYVIQQQLLQKNNLKSICIFVPQFTGCQTEDRVLTENQWTNILQICHDVFVQQNNFYLFILTEYIANDLL